MTYSKNKLRISIIVLLTIVAIFFENRVNADEISTKVEIDYPYSSQNVKDFLNYQGWIMSEDKDAIVEISIDGIKQVAPERYQRDDVLQAIKDYGGISTNKTPGYRGSIDVSHLTGGNHIFEVKAISKIGEVLETKFSKFNIKDYEGKIEIDKPTSNERVKTKLNYQGWVMSDDLNALVEVYVDGVQQTNVERYAREDVLKAISGYGGRSTNKTPGYRGSVDVSGLVNGVHTMTVRLVSSTGIVIKEATSRFFIKKYDTKLEIDHPYSNQKANGVLNFDGWVMSEDKDASINIYVDNTKVTPIKLERYEREDVLKVISGYGGKSLNPTPGYQGSIDISSLQDGVHAYKVEVVSKTGEVLASAYSNFRVNAYEGKIEIDKPTSNGRVKTKLDYQGWVMSEDKDDVVEIYIDGIKQTNVERYAREDVLKAISGYGGRSTNKTPGYRGSVDVSGLVDGVHTMTVRLVSSTGIVIKEATSSFPIKKYDTKLEIDSPLTNSIKKRTIDIQGWIMTEDLNGTIRLYMDDMEIDSSKIERYERDDVIKSISGYGGKELNPTPGFRTTIDSTNMKDGIHIFSVKFISSEKTSTTYSSIFKIKKYDAKINFDSPRLNHFTSSINIKGWEMSELDHSYVKVYMDNQELNIDLNRVERQDVLDFYQNQYGGKESNETPGFEGKIDISDISQGRHTLEFKVYSKLDELLVSHKNNICIKSCLPTYYNQTDARWKEVVYGLSSMGKTGCAPTSMAMAFSTILSKTILPTDVANYLYYNTNQFNRNMKGTSGLGILYAADRFRIVATPLTTKSMLSDALSSGKIVYAAMGNGKFATPFYNHAIILHDYSKGNTKAYDPLNTSNNVYVSIDQIWNEQSKDYDDYQGGSNFYSLEGYY